MTEGIIIALITGGLAVISNMIIIVVNNSKTLYRIEVLEKKVEKHNNFIERMYAAETEITELKEDIKEIKDRL